VTFDIRYAMLGDAEAERLYRSRPELRAGPDTYCPTCDKTGTYRWQGGEHPCDCALQLQLAKHYSAAGIGVLYQRMDWGDYGGDSELLQGVHDYLANHRAYVGQGIGLLFYGDIGTGKTLVANLVLKELVKLGYTCFATTFASTVEAFTSTWGSSSEKEWFARRFMHSQVLLLDDLGRELRTGHNLPQSTFDMILRTRVAEGRPTILTTNSSIAELEQGYGAQVLSLLKEQSLAWHFSGQDFRPTANQRRLSEIRNGEIRPIV